MTFKPLKLVSNNSIADNPDIDYKSLYFSLFNQVTSICNQLATAQLLAEEEYLKQSGEKLTLKSCTSSCKSD